jgi:hypothetical protein
MATPPSIPPAPPPWAQAGVPRRTRRWPTIAWLVAITLVSGVAIVGWLRPLSDHKPSTPTAPVYTDQQIATAKASVCAAFAKVDRALDVAGAQRGGDDPTSILAVATSVRQVLEVGSRYLSTKLTEQPATPPDLAKEVREFANSSQELVIGYLDGLTASDADLQPSRREGDETTLTIRRLCK